MTDFADAAVLPTLLGDAIARHRAFEFEEAERLYRAVLALEPEHADALHNLGVLYAIALGQPAQALPHFEAALNADAGRPQFWFSYIDALIRMGQYELATQLLPMAQAHGLQASMVNGLAERLARGVAVATPVAPPAPAPAPRQRAAAALGEADKQALVRLFQAGDYAKGERRTRELLERHPQEGFLWKALGTMLQPQGRKDEALAAKIRAAELLPHDVEALCNLGRAHFELSQVPQAIAVLRAAIQVKPDHAEAYNNLGLALNTHGESSEALTCFQRAVALKPDFAEAWNNLSGLYVATGDIDGGLHALRQALAAKPDLRIAFDNLLFVLNYHPDQSAEDIYAAYQAYDRQFGAPLAGTWRAHGNTALAGRRLKVGYVSADFRHHACARFVEPVLAGHDRAVLEVFAYAELRDEEDAMSQRYKSYVDHWVPTRALDDAALADRIRADGIDILVDLAGHTRGNRLGVFARKPAPVSLSWMGYGYTTGLTAIDYYLTDASSVPPGAEHLFSEKPWRLAGCSAVYRPAEGMGEVSTLPALQRGHVTLGCLSRSIRINHHTVRVWSQILQRLPDAQLVIDSKNFADEAACRALADRFAAHGIAPQRLQIGCHSPPWDVLRGLDIGLDCFPHNSGTTLYESLYMGVPYVTLAGRPSVGRLGSSILNGAGHGEWIARSEEEYVDKVVALAQDLPALAAVRQGLRAQMQASAQMDEAGFARSLEDAYRQMFARWSAAQPARGVPGDKPPSDMSLQELQAELLYNQGCDLHAQGRMADAEAALRQALVLRPGYPQALNNLGLVLQDLKRFAQAQACYRSALQIQPDYAVAHHNLGNALQQTGDLDEALGHYERALSLGLATEHLFENLLFALNYHPDRSAEQIFEGYREYERRFGLQYMGAWKPHGNARQAGRRLKVGYVSPDFRSHACGRFLEPLLAQHDKAAVQTYAYAELAREDEATQRYKSYVDHWVPTRGLDDAALAERIRADGIDILVDLAGHTRGNRLGVFARKPAPVSLSWMGYGYTTGLTAIDYYLTDASTVPPEAEHLFSEKPWRLEGCSAVYRPAEGMGEVSALPALQRGHVTLGCLSRSIRINHHTVRVWSQILQRLPDAQLVIDSGSFSDPATQQDLRARFVAHGIDPQRLQIGCHSPPWDVLRGLDIGLDCFPHNSGTTLYESLYMGVPYVTLAGRPSVGRLGSSILNGAGHGEWIARSEEEYVDKVVALAQDLPALAAVRQGLRAQMQASAQMDEAGFARSLEDAYRQMFATWCAGSADPLTAHVQRAQDAYNRGNDQDHQGLLAEAEMSFRRAVALVPDFAEANSNLAMVLHKQGRFAPADVLYRQALKLQPTSANAHYNLGANCKAQGQLDEAERCFRQALALRPDFVEAQLNLDRVLQELGRWTEAEVLWRGWLHAAPDSVFGYTHLAKVLGQQQRLEEAVECMRKARMIAPDDVSLHYQMVALYKNMGRFAQAEQCCRDALALDPDSAMGWNSLAEVFNATGRLVEAEEGFRKAVALDPTLSQAHGNLGIVLQNQGRLHEAEVCMRRSLALNPASAAAHGNLLFVMNYHPDKTGDEVFAEYRAYDERFCAPLRREWRPHGNARDPSRVLKVGYVSPDFRHHSITNFLLPVLARHDKREVRVFAYAELQREDAATLRYKQVVDHWIPTRGMSDAALAARIRADGIDILVDLAGHTGGNRLGVFARKPAPVSLSWMGYGCTTGLRAIDYFLCDAGLAPAGSERWFSEKPWRLPAACVYHPSAAPQMGDEGASPVARNGYVTFCTLTRAIRINHRTVRVWSELLRRVPRSRLVVDSRSYGDAQTQEDLARQFLAHGIARDRLQIGCHSPPWEVLRGVDISLDCFPHNSGTTLFESLYMGIPFVSLADRSSTGCLGQSILRTAGHPEWVAHTEEEYIEKAAALARDPAQLAQLRGVLRQQLQASAMMDEAGFTRNLEQAYRQMFALWCKESA